MLLKLGEQIRVHLEGEFFYRVPWWFVNYFYGGVGT